MMGSVSQAVGTVASSVGLVWSLQENVRALRGVLEVLEVWKRDLLHWIIEAEREGRQAVRLVEWWLSEVENLQEECREVIQSGGEHSGGFLHGLNVWSRYQRSRMALEKVEAATDLLATVQTFMVGEMPDERATRNATAMSRFAMPGVEEDDHTFQQLKDSILADGSGVFILHGVGGVGKTMVLQRLKNMLRHAFDAIAMVEVTESFREEEIQKQIEMQMGLRFEENQSNRQKRARIHAQLSATKFLIILDDVWDHIDLYSIGIPEPTALSKSKVLLATRIAAIAPSMQAKSTIELHCLSQQVAWDFFLDMAGRDFICSDSMIVKHAMTISHHCGGLPLALQMVGLAMSTKRTREEWEQVANCIDDDPSMIFTMEKKIFQSLKRSYDHLDGDELRQCFLHCALYPDGHVFDKHLLVEIFIKHGILDIRGGKEAAYSRGLDTISKLRSACMLEILTGIHGQDRVKMHSVMRGLALWIASGCGENKHISVRSGVKVGNEKRWDAATEVMSLMEDCVSSLPERPVCQMLHSILLVANRFLNKVPTEFFMNLPSLRVLDISSSPIDELPTGIGVCLNLQYLILSHTKLRSLPEGLGHLRRLVYLDISHTVRLQTIPAGVIFPKLTMLRVLHASPYSYDSWEVGFSRVSGAPLEELEGLASLKNLGITIKTRETLERLTSSMRLAGLVDDLHLNKLEGMETLGLPMPTLGQHMKKIGRLKIYSCSETQEVVIGGGGNMEPPAKLLEYLELWCLEKLDRIVYNQPKAGQFLHRLREFRIYRCSIEVVVDSNTDIVLPNLQCLHLGDLEKLKHICCSMSSFPRLKFLGVYRCPNLKRLPSGMGSTRSLKQICGQWEWWNALEWEEEGERRFLESLLNLQQQQH